MEEQGKVGNVLESKLNRRSLVKTSAAFAGAAALARAGKRTVRAQAGTEIEFMHIWGTPPGQPAAATKHPAEQLIEAFNAKNTGVTVVSRVESGDYLETLQKAQAEFASGKRAALIITPWTQVYYAIRGLSITPLEEVATAAGTTIDTLLANLKQQVIDFIKVDGVTAGLPFAFSTPVIYYNNDVFTQAGVDPVAGLADWASFATSSATLVEATGFPTLGLGNNFDWSAQCLAQNNGGRIMNDELKPVMDSPETIQALQTIADLNSAGGFLAAPPADARAAFLAGTLATWIGSIASLSGMRNDVTAFEFGTTTFPAFAGKPRKMSSGGSFIGCYAQDPDQQKAAWEFLNFAVSEEGSTIWGQTGYLNSTTYDLPVLPGQEPAYVQLGEGLTRETAFPGARAGEIQKLWGTYVERIYGGDISAEDGTKEAKAEIEALLPEE
jgi:multiple sugar transport system substrate-binding protein